MKITTIFLAVLLQVPSAMAADKPVVAIHADGAYSDQARGALYAAIANAAEVLEDADVRNVLERLSVVPPIERSLDELAWDNERAARVQKATGVLDADLVVLVRVKERSKRHLTVSAVVIGKDSSAPLLSEVWTITARGKKGEETFSYAPIRNALMRLVNELPPAS